MKNHEVYNKLRDMHTILKEIIYNDDAMSNDKENAIEAVNSVLYLAEGVFSKEE